MSGVIEEKKTAYEGGATRSETHERFDLIPYIAQRREAVRWGLGAEKHGENNWMNGGEAFVRSCFNHMEAHLNKLKESGDDLDDNLAAIRWGASALMWFETNKPAEFKAALEKMRGAVSKNLQTKLPVKKLGTK